MNENTLSLVIFNLFASLIATVLIKLSGRYVFIISTFFDRAFCDEIDGSTYIEKRKNIISEIVLVVILFFIYNFGTFIFSDGELRLVGFVALAVGVFLGITVSKTSLFDYLLKLLCLPIEALLKLFRFLYLKILSRFKSNYNE